MNKLLTKIVGVALGASMAIGVGVAVVANSKDTVKAEATGKNDWTQVTAITGLNTTDTYVIANNADKGYYFKGTQSSGHLQSEQFSASNPASNEAAGVFKLEAVDAANYIYKIKLVSTKKYVTSSKASSGGGVVNSSSDSDGWRFSYNSGFNAIYQKSYSGSYASLRCYNNTTWRTYTASSQTSPSGNGTVFRLYKYTTSAKTATTTTVNSTSTSLSVGGTATLSATVSYSGGTVTSPTVTYSSSDESVATVSGNTVTAVAAGTTTITGSYAGDSTYEASSGNISITVTKAALPSMPSGDYGKITSSSDLTNGYYLLVCEDNSKAFDGSLSTLSSNPGASVSISNNAIGSTSTIDTYALYIASNGQTNGYSIAAKVKYADNGYKYIGRDADSNGVDESNSELENTITFDGNGHALITGKGSRRIRANNSSTYQMQYYSSSGAANLFLYKKGATATTFSVTYDANGATDGEVPTDATAYANGATVTVKQNSGSLVKTDYTFNGWNTRADGEGTHYAASGSATFTISENTTLYAEWVKSLDAITAIGGSVSATLSSKGTYNWNYSNITVTGTLSGATGQNVKNYVDLSSTTLIPTTTGSCTVSVTATKKSSVPGSATSLTNNEISGEVEAAKLVYTFTMSYSDLTQTSYGNEDNVIKTSTATCADHESIDINWRTSNVQKNNNSGTYSMQFRGSPVGYLYNTTEIPGTITSVSYNDSILAGEFTTYYGDSEHPTESTTVGGKYFSIVSSSGTDKVQSITVTFEVSDKPKVQLVATNLNLDVADGAATATVTDGTSAVTGYSLTSEDSYIASITGDMKVQPTGYGKVTISVTKEEDSGHIYLATTFTVTVGDHSKEASIMAFAARAADDVANRTADDGVVWTITCSRSENAFSDVYGINYGTNNDKVNSLVLTAPADEDRIIKNVVVEAMSNSEGSSIAVTVGSTSLTCPKSTSLGGTVSTYNFSGSVSGQITITISGTQSSKYGVKSIAVLYVGDEATSFASTFLGAISCNSAGTSKPTFNLQPDGVTPWTWALLKAEYDALDPTDQAKFAVGATGVSSTISECVERYDYIVGKYYKTGIDTSFTDFMGRNPSPIGSSSAILPIGVTNNSNAAAIIVVISMITVTAVGGYFFMRKRKEQ